MTARPSSATPWMREARRTLRRRRRPVAALLATGAVGAGLLALSPPAAPTVPVLRAVRDLPGGTPLTARDVEVRAMPPGLAPEGALTRSADVTGRVLAAPARRGEPLTDVRLVGRDLLEGYGGGTVATPVRIADPGAVALLRAGDLVDVLAADAAAFASERTADAREQSPAGVVAARGVRVLTVPGPEGADGAAGPAAVGSGGSDAGALVVLATTPDVAVRLAGAAASSRLSVVLRRG